MKETSSPKKTKTPIKEKANEEALVKTTISKVKADDTTFTVIISGWIYCLPNYNKYVIILR